MTFEEIVDLLANDGGECRKCMLVNELGELLLAGDQKAGGELAKLLADDDDCVRAPAYVWLCQGAGRTFGPQLNAFAKEAKNAAIVNWARDVHGVSLPS